MRMVAKMVTRDIVGISGFMLDRDVNMPNCFLRGENG